MFTVPDSVTPPWPTALGGRIERLTVASDLLRGNPLGDPHERPLWVYLPPGYADERRRFPSAYLLHGYGGSVVSWGDRPSYGRTVLELIDAAITAGQIPQAIVVCVDGWTRYGGSQWIDSPGTGAYHSYLCEEIVGYVDARYRTRPGREHRVVAGKSSGGFGALVAAMRRPDLFGGCASHAGDAFYEVVYQPHLRDVVRGLRPWDGDVMAWWRDFQARCPDVRPADRMLEYVLGVSACFSPGSDGAPVLPMDPVTGEMRPGPWQQWLDWDPVRMIPGHARQLRSLRAVWLDAGSEDDFFLDLGVAALRRAMDGIGMPDGAVCSGIVAGADHDSIGRRQVDSLGWMLHRLGAEDG